MDSKNNKTRVVIREIVATILIGDEKIPLQKVVFDDYVDNRKLSDKAVIDIKFYP